MLLAKFSTKFLVASYQYRAIVRSCDRDVRANRASDRACVRRVRACSRTACVVSTHIDRYSSLRERCARAPGRARQQAFLHASVPACVRATEQAPGESSVGSERSARRMSRAATVLRHLQACTGGRVDRPDPPAAAPALPVRFPAAGIGNMTP
jgi:hypothetical protein